MAYTARPDQLQVGDVYATTMQLNPELRRVTAIRTIRYAETYKVVDTEGIDSGLHGEMNLNVAKATVTVVEQVDPVRLRAIIESLPFGTSLTIYRRQNGEFYA